jgi:hypothetical protein
MPREALAGHRIPDTQVTILPPDPAAGWRGRAWLLVPPLLAWVLGTLLLLVSARLEGVEFFTVHSWGRWDTGHYLTIASQGYYTTPCSVRQLPPSAPPGDNLCGNAGWLPLYPWLMRLVSFTGLGLPQAGVLVTTVFALLTLLVIWVLLDGRADPVRRFPALLLGAVFPGMVYAHAVFPVSLTTFTTAACLLGWDRRRWLLSGLAGAGAALSYISGLLLAPVLAAAAVTEQITTAMARPRRPQPPVLRGPAIAAGGVLAGFAAFMLLQWVQLGILGAYFKSTRKFGVGIHNPVPVWFDKVSPAFTSLFGDATLAPGAVAKAWQTLLVAVIVVAAIGATLAAGRLTRLDWVLVFFTLAFWVFPHLAGESASHFRSEALLVPCVVLVRHLPVAVQWLFAAAAAALVFWMAPLFWSGVLT